MSTECLWSLGEPADVLDSEGELVHGSRLMRAYDTYPSFDILFDEDAD